MKLFYVSWLILGWCFTLGAQTNPPGATAEILTAAPAETVPAAVTNAPDGTNSPAASQPFFLILGDRSYVELKSNIAIYTGHAGIDHPDMQVRCWVLRFEVPRLTVSNYNRVTAESNVVIDYWKTNHATADKAVVTKTLSNGVASILVELIGNACVTNPMGAITGANWVIWDPINQKVQTEGGTTTLRPGEHDMATPFGLPFQTKTNAPARKTNAPAIKPPLRQ